MENKNLNFFSDSYKYDINILNNLQILLIQNQINKEFTLDHSLHSYLEEPFVGKNYVSLTEESVTIYSNEELVRSLNDLIKDYNNLLELFGKVNEERKVLRKYNILLLQKLFSLEFGMQTASENDFQNYLNRVIFMNQEFLKKYVHILEEKLSQSSLQRDYKDLEVSQLKSQIEKLEKKLISSRENLKQYLITGKFDETTTIPNFKTLPCMQSVTTLPISEDLSTESPNNHLENVSISKTQEARKPMKLVSNVKLNKFKENLKTQPDESTIKKPPKPNGIEKKIIRTPMTKKTMHETSIIGKKDKINYLKKSSMDLNLKTAKDENREDAKNEKRLLKPGLKKLSSSMSTTDFSNLSKKTESRKTLGSIHDIGKINMIKKKK